MTRRRIAHFEILEPIGRGGMGVVYRARDTHLNRPVAIKVLPPSFSTHPDRRSRFLREARAAANLNHPNIATVYQFGPAMVDDGELVTPVPGQESRQVEILFLAMELIPGDDLHTVLEAGPLPVETALDHALQIARGLDAAHRAGVTHRDLKPKNVRITPEGQVKILDFGLAKVHGPELPAAVAEESVFETTQGMVLGTPPYMAPEQLRGEVVDARADLYALGMVLYQMLAGRLPYPSKNLLDYAKALASAEGPPSLSQTRSEVLEDLGTPEVTAQVTGEHESIVRRLLEQEPEARYPSAREVITALKAASGWESGITHPRAPIPTAAYTQDTDVTRVQPSREIDLQAASPRSRRWLGAALVAVLAMVVWIASIWLEGTQQSGPIQVVVLLEDDSERLESGENLVSRLVRGLEGELVRLDGVEIISNREAAPLQDKGMRYTEIADELGADCLLQGTLLPDEHLYVQLLEGEGAKLQWNFTFSLAAASGDFDSESVMLRLLVSVVDLWRGVRGSLKASHFRERGEATAPEVDALNGDLGMTTDLFEQAVEIDPEDSQAHAGLSQVYYQLLRQTGDGQYLPKVQEHADRALALDPNHVEARVARGRYLRYQGDLEESISELKRAVDLAPTADLALFELAVSLEQAGVLEEAVAYLEKAIEHRPQYWFYRNQLGAILMEYFGRFELARRYLETALELAIGPQKYWPLSNLGVLEILREDYKEAIAWLERLPESQRDSVVANNLGMAYFQTERFEEAAEQFRAAIRMDPEDGGYFRGLGDTLLRLGRSEEAAAQFRLAMEKLNAEPNPTSWRRALYLAKTGQCREALKVTRDSLEVARGYPPASSALLLTEFAKARTLCDDRQGALALLNEALELGHAGSLRDAMEFDALVGEPLFERLADRAKGAKSG